MPARPPISPIRAIADAEAKAQALAVRGRKPGRSDQWRPALRIYKTSLGLSPDPDVQKAYDQAFNEHGFRMLDYTSGQ